MAEKKARKEAEKQKEREWEMREEMRLQNQVQQLKEEHAAQLQQEGKQADVPPKPERQIAPRPDLEQSEPPKFMS